MREEILAVMRKHKIKIFTFIQEDLFTYVLETETPVTKDVLDEIKNAAWSGAEIKNKVVLPVNPPKSWKDVHTKEMFEFANKWAIQKLTPTIFEEAFKEFCILTDKEKFQFIFYQIWRREK